MCVYMCVHAHTHACGGPKCVYGETWGQYQVSSCTYLHLLLLLLLPLWLQKPLPTCSELQELTKELNSIYLKSLHWFPNDWQNWTQLITLHCLISVELHWYNSTHLDWTNCLTRSTFTALRQLFFHVLFTWELGASYLHQIFIWFFTSSVP